MLSNGTLRKMARLAAVLVFCLVVATATAQAGIASTMGPQTYSAAAVKHAVKKPAGHRKVALVITMPNPPAATFTTVTFKFTTNVPAQATVLTGTDPKYLWPTRDVHYRKGMHTIRVPGLKSGTPYYAVVVAKPKKGPAKKLSANFQTAAIGSGPAVITNRGRKLFWNGQVFFPITVKLHNYPCPDPSVVEGASVVGAFSFTAEDDTITACDGQAPSQWGESLHSLLNDKLGWIELNQNALQQLQSQQLPELVNWRASAQEFPGSKIQENLCVSSTKLFSTLSAMTQTSSIIFPEWLGTYYGPGKKWCTSPSNWSMVFWTTVIARGAGVQYDIGDVKGPFDVTSELQATTTKLANQMGTIGPCVMAGKPVAVNIDPKSTVKVAAWQYAGSICVVAVNTGDSAAKAAFSAVGLTSIKTARVFWEGRNVRLKKGSIDDSFQPQGWHVYEMTLPLMGKKK